MIANEFCQVNAPEEDCICYPCHHPEKKLYFGEFLLLEEMIWKKKHLNQVCFKRVALLLQGICVLDNGNWWLFYTKLFINKAESQPGLFVQEMGFDLMREGIVIHLHSFIINLDEQPVVLRLWDFKFLSALLNQLMSRGVGPICQCPCFGISLHKRNCNEILEKKEDHFWNNINTPPDSIKMQLYLCRKFLSGLFTIKNRNAIN